MSDTDDDHRALSRYLWDILDRIGLTADVRESVVNGTITCELLWMLRCERSRKNVSFYLFGSSCEATKTIGLHSDVDILDCFDEFLVVANLDYVHGDGICFLLVSDGHTHPGYCKLQVVNDGIPQMAAMRDIPQHESFTSDRYGRVVLTSICRFISNKYRKHGPAYKDTENLTDHVFALRCIPWPESAEEWLTRTRPHNWPPADQIQKLHTRGCFLVPVGHPHSPEESMEWRISFSLLERELMLTLNEEQYRCYILMKVTIKDMITSQLGDSISSYHCKTVLFYAKENTPAEFWVPENLIKCLIYCLNELYTCVVRGICPSYFIRQENLFDRRIHGDMQTRVARLLGELVQRNATYLFDVKCDDIGLQLAAAADPLAHLTTRACMSIKYANTHIMYKFQIYSSVACAILHSVNVSLYDTVSNTKTPSISTLEDLLARLSSITRVMEHTEDQTREAVQLMLPLLHTSLASHLAARLLQLSPGDTEAQNIRRQLDTHVQVVNASANISCRLKLATIHYMLAEYKICEQIVSVITDQMVQCPFVYNACACLTKRGSHDSKHFMNTLSSKTMSCSDILDKYFGFCVSFMPSEMDVTTTGLQFEMYKSVKTSPASFNTSRLPQWYEWSNVDSIVLIHLMQYLLYDKMGDDRRKQLAVHNLADVVTSDVTTDAKLNHMETAYNLLGWIYKREGDINMAAHCFVKSIRLEPVHNAAKWHIADLYLQVHQARSRR